MLSLTLLSSVDGYCVVALSLTAFFFVEPCSIAHHGAFSPGSTGFACIQWLYGRVSVAWLHTHTHALQPHAHARCSLLWWMPLARALPCLQQPRQPARQRLRSQQHARNIERRGKVPTSTKEKKEGYTVGPVLLAFFLFVVVGSGT